MNVDLSVVSNKAIPASFTYTFMESGSEEVSLKAAKKELIFLPCSIPPKGVKKSVSKYQGASGR